MIHPSSPAMRRAYADWSHGQIHYYDGGGEGVPLLLLHQSPASSSDWFPLIPHLQDAGIRVMAMDTPGMGLSDPLPHEPTLEEYADAIPAVLAHAGVDKVDLLGHHTGVQIAVEAAARHADNVRSVALYGVPVMTSEEREAYWQQIVPNEIAGAIHRAIPGGDNLGSHFRRIENFYTPVGSQRMILSALLAGPLWWHGHNAALRHDMAPTLSALTQPILLITNPGEMLDANTQAARALRPDAAYVSLPTAGSIAMEDDPAGLAQAVLSFLNSLD